MDVNNEVVLLYRRWGLVFQFGGKDTNKLKKKEREKEVFL